MTRRFSVCLFCGSRAGADPAYAQAARDFGAGLASRGWRLVYGGGDVGLMGVAADAATHAGGEVLGIIPERLMTLEVGKTDITELVVTPTMFDRKSRMIAESDAFVTLPGGLGTLDEILEVITLRQLGYFDKPILLVDLLGYWAPFGAMIDQVIDQGFAAPSAASLVETVPDIERLFASLDGFVARPG